MASNDWQAISAKAKEKLNSSIPQDWRISKDELPPPDTRDVTDFPSKCGILTENEVAITDSYASDIVEKIAAGEWKAEDVTRAFCKRAAIAHQVVSRQTYR